MSHRQNRYGDLPVYQNGANGGHLNRRKVARLYNFTHREIVKAYNNWIRIDRITGSTLTFKSYLDKMLEAEITPNQVGKRLADYNLSRYGDDGPYTETSCRFITTKENASEQSHAISIYEATVKKHGKEETHRMFALNGSKGGKKSAGLPRKRK